MCRSDFDETWDVWMSWWGEGDDADRLEAVARYLRGWQL